jgi:hypothetical protein
MPPCVGTQLGLEADPRDALAVRDCVPRLGDRRLLLGCRRALSHDAAIEHDVIGSSVTCSSQRPTASTDSARRSVDEAMEICPGDGPHVASCDSPSAAPPALVVLRGRREVGKSFLLRVAVPRHDRHRSAALRVRFDDAQVIETLRRYDGSIEERANYLDPHAAQVEAALRYLRRLRRRVGSLDRAQPCRLRARA